MNLRLRLQRDKHLSWKNNIDKLIPKLHEALLLRAHTHAQRERERGGEIHIQPHLPTFYHNNTLLYCILSFR